ncbi:ParB/RepB/Spo0J family partition protein [Pontibaca methylaminivorans]|uniref:Chromosome segregation protein Spo0J, contains ParB-like nuclease domain n=1 Tax=Pontibaca methylaminivorans TaxID=515897 RepID=A0A1R3X7F3_9RHOB|nr:ParB/RepB/Spo0J family partition protein [Pontibaca methylaminivorans]SIT86845.1 Chromosome segregation protein Spo0J, contains ParB-like nuclease domain [Pontibaca methylaminivorans]
MARRKRLSPARPGGSGTPEGADAPALHRGLGPAPIAQVAGEAAASAALAELAGALDDARESGRLIEEIPLSAVDVHYLMRDRIEQDEEEMQALMASLRARGQQTAIEVVALERPGGGGVQGKTHGLVSGWRRVSALERLYRETDDPRFAHVRAITIAPGNARDAYVAMVEENEIRVNLSLYERARIAIRAMQQDLYETERAALQGLFGATTRSKRSKIGSFIPVVEALDSVLRHPTAISERLGLALSRALAADPGAGEHLRRILRMAPPEGAEAEMRALGDALEELQRPDGTERDGSGQDAARATPPPAPGTAAPAGPRPRLRSTGPDMAAGERVNTTPLPGLTLGFTASRNRIEITGAPVTQELYEALEDWLRAQRKRSQ